MEMTIEMANDFKELAKFLAKLNQQKKSHIGYCGEKVDEIYATLKKDFIDENVESTFYVTRNGNKEIEIAIGF